MLIVEHAVDRIVVGKFEKVTLDVIAQDNKIVHATGFIMTEQLTSMKPQSRITFEGDTYEIISIETVKTLMGFHHLEVYLR